MCKRSILLLLTCLLAARHAGGQAPTSPTYFTHVCRTDFGTYTTASTYQSNLASVLETLYSRTTAQTSYNTSAGSGEDAVYAQYYCRGDIGTQLCSDCVTAAGNALSSSCANYKAALIWYEECTLRYENQSMYAVYAEYPRSWSWSTANVTDPATFAGVLKATKDTVIDKAAHKNVSLHFAAGAGDVVSQSVILYLLAQCSPDLVESDCATCLGSTYDQFVEVTGDGQEWSLSMWVYFPSCQMRYSTTGPFYDVPGAPPVSVPSTPESVGTATQASSPVHSNTSNGKKATNYVIVAVVPAAVIGLLVLLGVSFCLIKRNGALSNSSSSRHPATERGIEVGAEESGVQNSDCVQFNLKTIEAATNKFSVSNKLGQGGFGIVYQGALKDGQTIAVKRLSSNSGQGTKEFKTEVAVVAKLQHRNLVRLVGCCVDREERLLVYEFLRNLSLDRFLYDAMRSTYLTWAVRHKIIQGIARGLHYLHEDSRVKIVHRDLKISNILLDDNLEPKIADFGLAKLVHVDQTFDNTTKVAGTRGYMSPEYALAGRYSTKSDVYSFGVIVLEILSGKVNSEFYDVSQGEGLLSYAWRAWNEGTIEKLIDPSLQGNYSRLEAERFLQLGLLCVQDDEASRPPMHAVLVILNSNTAEIPLPLSPLHSTYSNKLSSWDDSQGGTTKQLDNESVVSLDTFSAHKNLSAR